MPGEAHLGSFCERTGHRPARGWESLPVAIDSTVISLLLIDIKDSVHSFASVYPQPSKMAQAYGTYHRTESQGAGRLVHCRFVGYVVFALPELLDAYPLDLRLQGRVLVGFVGQSFLGTKLVSLEKVSVGSFA